MSFNAMSELATELNQRVKELEKELAEERERVCEWHEENAYWKLGCRPHHITEINGAAIRFCPFCGGRLVIL